MSILTKLPFFPASVYAFWGPLHAYPAHFCRRHRQAAPPFVSRPACLPMPTTVTQLKQVSCKAGRSVGLPADRKIRRPGGFSFSWAHI